MAKETALKLFQGEDRRYLFTVLNIDETAAIDITGWTLTWMVKRHASDADVNALITKTTVTGIAIAGVFNSVPALNAQIAYVTVARADSLAVPDGSYFHELRRMDSGFNTVGSYGQFRLTQGVIR